MKKQDFENLKKRLERAIESYTDAFCKKQKIKLDFWVLDQIGTIGCFGDNLFSFTDIKYDMDTDQPPGQIFEWQSECLDKSNFINYYSYSKGLRP